MNIRKRIEKITRAACDPEKAHILEDNLHVDVLRAIATGVLSAEEAAALAMEAVKTTEIDFSRWYS